MTITGMDEEIAARPAGAIPVTRTCPDGREYNPALARAAEVMIKVTGLPAWPLIRLTNPEGFGALVFLPVVAAFWGVFGYYAFGKSWAGAIGLPVALFGGSALLNKLANPECRPGR